MKTQQISKWVLMYGTHTKKKKKKKPLKIKSFEKKLHLGFLEFLLGAAESANPVTPALDDAILELIIDKKINKTKPKKKTAFFFLLCFSQIKKQNKPTNPQSEFDSKSKPWNFREREQKGISQFGPCCLLLLLLLF